MRMLSLRHLVLIHGHKVRLLYVFFKLGVQVASLFAWVDESADVEDLMCTLVAYGKVAHCKV